MAAGIGLTLTGVALALVSFKSAMRQHSDRIEDRSQLAPTRFGQVEYALREAARPSS